MNKLIIDFSGLALASIYAENKDLSLDFFRHMILNSIRNLKIKFGRDSEVIIAIDSKNPWRKDVFPYYKANRKTAREKSTLDWKTIYENIGIIKQELKENFPYKVIEVPRAEADDIIATLVHKFGVHLGQEDQITICSADKDFIQLQEYSNVRQWDNARQRWISGNAIEYLREHIIRGDTGDGVPSAISPDATFVEKIRQKPITQKKIAEWLPLTIEELYQNFDFLGYSLRLKRNEILIDLKNTPKEIQEQVLEEYNIPVAKKDLTSYFIKNKLKLLYDNIGDF